MNDGMDILNFKRILAKNPKSLLFARLADSMRAMSLGTEAKLDEALLIANKGLEANPNFLQGRLVRGRILLEKGDLLGAKIDFEAVAKLDQFCFSAQKLLLETSEKLEQPVHTEVYEKILEFFEQKKTDGTANNTGGQQKKVELKSAKPAVSASKPAPESASLSAALDNILSEDEDEESEISNLIFKAVDNLIGLELPALGSSSMLEVSKDNNTKKPNIDSVLAEALAGSESEPELKPYEPKKKTKVMPAVTLPPATTVPAPLATPVKPAAAEPPPIAIAPLVATAPLPELAKPAAAEPPPIAIAPLVATAPLPELTKPAAAEPPPIAIAPLVATAPLPELAKPAAAEPPIAIAPLVATAPLPELAKPAAAEPPIAIAPLVPTAPPTTTAPLATTAPPVAATAPPKTVSPAAPNLEDILKEQLSDKVENLPDLTTDINSVLAEAANLSKNEPEPEPELKPYVPKNAASKASAPPAATPPSVAPLAATAHPVANISPIAPNLEDILKEQLSDKMENLPDLTTDIDSVLAEAASLSKPEPEPELKPYVPPAKTASPAAPNIEDILKEQLSDKVENLPDLTTDIDSVLAEAAKFTAEPEPELKPYVPPSAAGKASASSAAPNIEDILKEQLSDKMEDIPDFTSDMDSLLKEHQDKTLAQNPTPTLAELYMDQGLPQKAAEVYRELLARNPDNKELKTKLALAEMHA